MPAATDRYRCEGDTWCIDLRVKQIRQLFDLRDPAPFRDRDLDAGVVEYVTEAAGEIPRADKLRIAVFVSDETEPALPESEVESAVHAHFEHASELLGRRVRGHLRQGQIATLVGLTVLTTFLLLSESIDPTRSTWRKILREGLVIGGWVAIWRPVEHFLYDWWPFLDERTMLRRLCAAEIVVHYGSRGPEGRASRLGT